MQTKYGLSETQWIEAKAEIRRILIEVAQHRSTITYGELASQLTTVSVHPYAYAFGALLREVCNDEEVAGRGLMCALVVQKSSGMPGNGFFKYAGQLGRDVSDYKTCWYAEIERLYAIWDSNESDI